MTNNYVYVLKSTISMYEVPTIDGIFDNKEGLETVMKELNIKKSEEVRNGEPKLIYYTVDDYVKQTYKEETVKRYYFVHKIELNHYDWYLDDRYSETTDLDI